MKRVLILTAVVILTLVLNSWADSKTGIEVVEGKNGFKKIYDWDNGIVKILMDDADGQSREIEQIEIGDRGFVHLPYYDSLGQVILDVYIEETYYNNNQTALQNFWDEFVIRFDTIKTMTGWSSLRWFGTPLEIYVYGTPDRCNFGNASPTHSNVILSDPLYQTGCERPYYVDGIEQYGNPGVLGDHWPQMMEALMQATRSITPYQIYTRSWLINGFAIHIGFRTLVANNDINQETADEYMHDGYDITKYWVDFGTEDTTFSFYSASEFNWDCYIANDYHDCSVYERELQRSHSYSITAWLFSLLESDHILDWDLFYTILNNNKETLDKTFSLYPYIYYTDAFVTYVFGLAMGHTDFYTETEPIFRYDGPDGPGYGMRCYDVWPGHGDTTFTEFDWFADLTIDVAVLDTSSLIVPGDSIKVFAIVNNLGDFELGDSSQQIVGAVTRIYQSSTIIKEDTLIIEAMSSDTVFAHFVPTTPGGYEISVTVDEMNLKIELDDSNNSAFDTIFVDFDSDADGIGDTYDNCPSIANPDQTNSDTDSFGDLCDNCPTIDNEDQADADSDDVGDVCDICPNHELDDCCNPVGINNPPEVISASADTVQPSPDEYIYIANITDPDCDGTELTLAFENLPSWCTVNADTLRGYVACDYADTSFSVIASDGDMADTMVVSLVIDHSNQAPEITDTASYVEVKNKTEYTYYPAFADPDDVSHTISYPSYPAWCVIQNDTIVGTAPDSLLTQALTVVVSDYCKADTLSFDVSTFVCGDANHDGIVDVSDAVYVINYAFAGGPAPDPEESGDANCDGGVDVSDAVYIINYAFAGGNPPCDTDDDGIPDC